MKNVPDTPPSPGFINKEQTAITAIIAPGGNGGSPITNYILGYALSTTLAPPLPTDVITHGTQASFRLTGLEPGRKYRFWAKTANQYGESDWSAPIYSTLIAGAWVKQGAVWVKAVPYVNVAGVWTMAMPWVKNAGVWKQVSE